MEACAQHLLVRLPALAAARAVVRVAVAVLRGGRAVVLADAPVVAQALVPADGPVVADPEAALVDGPVGIPMGARMDAAMDAVSAAVVRARVARALRPPWWNIAGRWRFQRRSL